MSKQANKGRAIIKRAKKYADPAFDASLARFGEIKDNVPEEAPSGGTSVESGIFTYQDFKNPANLVKAVGFDNLTTENSIEVGHHLTSNNGATGLVYRISHNISMKGFGGGGVSNGSGEVFIKELTGDWDNSTSFTVDETEDTADINNVFTRSMVTLVELPANTIITYVAWDVTEIYSGAGIDNIQVTPEISGNQIMSTISPQSLQKTQQPVVPNGNSFSNNSTTIVHLSLYSDGNIDDLEQGSFKFYYTKLSLV
jgi:hypothetical protein